VTEGPDERFARFRLISWWEQSRLSRARVLVIGAGALGNEVLKNLALLGVGRVVVVDLDRIELSNLSRSVLFRPEDAGAPKAAVAARAVKALYPDIRCVGLAADVVHEIGAGLFAWADVVVGALDNREARLAVNRLCYRLGTPWIDGAIEALSGVARVFVPPEGACYECSMSELDWKLLAQRHSCSLLNRTLAAVGPVPTTPTTASVIAGVQCQEALKLLHGMPSSLAGRGMVFEGMEHTSYSVDYVRNPECLSHEPLDQVVRTGERAGSLSVAGALEWARDAAGPKATLVFLRELLSGLDCASCGSSEEALRPLASITEDEARCPSCAERRTPRLFHSVEGTEDFLDRPLSSIGVPPWDLIVATTPEVTVGLELDGDRPEVLGSCEDLRGGTP